jgi:hypothetical protein
VPRKVTHTVENLHAEDAELSAEDLTEFAHPRKGWRYIDVVECQPVTPLELKLSGYDYSID